MCRKDAIIDRFNLDPHTFKPAIKDTRTQIQITAHRNDVPETGNAQLELLGFILFDKTAGSVELTNFKTHLEVKYLHIGESSKEGQEKFAGVHGEGFKIGALVMRRQGHSVRITSSSYYWNFNFGGAHREMLCCNLSQAKAHVVRRKREAYAQKAAKKNFQRPLEANIWEDVTVKIGKSRGNDSTKLSEAEFREWLHASIELCPPDPTGLVRTTYGDLIMDPQFSNHIYLKGLRVPGYKSSGRNYVFGYNFIRGNIDRDRHRLANPSEEASMVTNIWHGAMTAEGYRVTDAYVKLFHEHEDCADIAFAKDKVSSSTAEIIWHWLRSTSPDVFFYTESDQPTPSTVDQVRFSTDASCNC